MDMKGWNVALLGIAALGMAGVSEGKVLALDAAPNTAVAAFTTLGRQADNLPGNYVQSAYFERPYGILSVSAATNVNYEPAEARDGMQSFRELSADDTRTQLSGGRVYGSFGSTVSEKDGATGITDACVTLLTICGLAVYQLRRKQQLLKHLPLSH
jgi:hypothetical protein